MKTLIIPFLFLFLHAHAPAMDAEHLQQHKRLAGHSIFTTGGIHQAENTWIYREDFSLEEEYELQPNWHFYFTPDDTPPDANAWTNLDFHRIHLNPAEVIPNFATPGYYYIHSGNPGHFIKIIRVGIHSFTANKTVVPPNDRTAPVQFSFQTQPPGYSNHLQIQITGTGHTTGTRQNEEPFHIPHGVPTLPPLPGTGFTWDIPGRKSATLITPDGNSRSLNIDIALVIPRAEILLPVNANDSNNDKKKDLKQYVLYKPGYNENNGEDEIFLEDDPDLKKVDFHLSCPSDQPGQQPHWEVPLGNPGENENKAAAFLAGLANRDLTVRITRSPGIQLFLDNTKGNSRRLVNTGIYDPSFEGNGAFEADAERNGTWTFAFDNIATDNQERFIDNAQELFNTLYIEGISGSPAPAEDFLQCEILSGDQPVLSCKLPATVIHLRMNHSPNAIDLHINEENGVDMGIDENNPLNIIYNPAFILRPNAIEPETDPDAIFLLEEKEQAFLDNPPYQDAIEWSIGPVPNFKVTLGNGTSDYIGAREGGEAIFVGPAHGKTIRLRGIRDGFVRLGIRIKGFNTDYIQCHALVGPEIKIPYAFQFFLPGPDTPELIDDIIANILPGTIQTCNILFRQAGLKLVPARQEQLQTRSNIHQHIQPAAIVDNPSGLIQELQFDHFPYQLFMASEIPDDVTINLNRKLLDTIPFALLDQHGNILLNDLANGPFGQPPLGLPVNHHTAPPLFTLPYKIPKNLLQNIRIGIDIPPHTHRQIPNQPIFIFNKIPDFICNTYSDSLVYTHSISSIVGALNINIIPTATDVYGVTSAWPPNRLAAPRREVTQSLLGEEERQIQKLPPAPSAWLRTNPQIIDNQTVWEETYFDFPGINVKIDRLFHNLQANPRRTPLTPYFPAALTIVHETGHALNLLHRNPYKENQDNDGLALTGYIPSVDILTSEIHSTPRAESNNIKNIMTIGPNRSLDFDLLQTTIMRQTQLPEP